jgi:hypothetical protein
VGKDVINQKDAKDGDHSKWLHVVITAVVSSVISSNVGKFTVKGKLGKRTDADYNGLCGLKVGVDARLPFADGVRNDVWAGGAICATNAAPLPVVVGVWRND